MLKRKIEDKIRQHLLDNTEKILLVDGARQVGKSYIIRHVGNELFENFIEINMAVDQATNKRFESVQGINDFYFQLSILAGNKLDKKENTLVFLDEIQTYPYLLTLLKFLNQDGKYTYIASGSLLGIALSETSSIPIGSISKIQMYPLDFEEFLWANNVGALAIDSIRDHFLKMESLDEASHKMMMNFFKMYLIVGGLPEVVNTYLDTQNIARVRSVQSEIQSFYAQDASKYDKEKKLKIRRIYEMIPSVMENKKKRIVIKDIENKTGKRYSDYENEFEYLVNSGIALSVQAISNPHFPLIETAGKNLLKLYINDVGLLTNMLYGLNPDAILNDVKGINLGAVYETVVSTELAAHGFRLFYYDNKTHGEVDYLIDDYENLTVLPLEVKSGKDYTIHNALNHFIQTDDYNIQKAYVLSNKQNVKQKDKIIYIPIYYIMFLKKDFEILPLKIDEILS